MTVMRSDPGRGRPTTAAGALLLAGEWTAAALFVVAVYEIVVGTVVRLWPDMPDDRVLLFWIAAAAICGAGTGPVRAGVRAAAARRWPGAGGEAYETLAAVAAKNAETKETAGTPCGPEPLARLAAIARAGTRAQRVEVWVADHGGLRRTASHPPGDPAAPAGSVTGPAGLAGMPGADHVVPITESGTLLGAVTFTAPRRRPLTTSDLRLAGDLANAAGPLLRALELDERLRERIQSEAGQAAAMDVSRRRLIAARDEAREQLGQEIQAEVCATLEHCAQTLGALAGSPVGGPALTAAVETLSQQIDRAIDRFRRLVRGVYPAALTDHGLGPALENLVADLPRPATVVDPALPRFSARVEACAFFCLSALLRSWPGGPDVGRILIEPRVVDGDLLVSAANTAGSPSARFDPPVLESVLDRVAALEGSLAVESVAGRLGVVVRIPIDDIGGF